LPLFAACRDHGGNGWAIMIGGPLQTHLSDLQQKECHRQQMF
jgi:hypothetical protein